MAYKPVYSKGIGFSVSKLSNKLQWTDLTDMQHWLVPRDLHSLSVYLFE